MARPSGTRTLAVWMNGERVGRWTVRPGQPDQFDYDERWLDSPAVRPISLSMPLRRLPYRGATVAAWFDNLLPDSRAIRERLQRRYGTATAGRFDLLAEIGRDCVGAIQLLGEDAPTPEVRRITGEPLNERQIESLLLAQLSPLPGALDTADFRISLAGAQEKTALLRHEDRWLRPTGATPSTHILKLPLGTGGGGIDLSSSVENEWLCAQLLAAYEVPVAACAMARFGQQRALVVERFDRRLSADGRWLLRLPQEDACQATGTPGERKYEADGGPGIERLMTVLLGSSHADADRHDFFRTQLLYWMLCAIDGHAKNFSLAIDAGGAYRLTPRYDVLSAFPMLGNGRGRLPAKKARMAMAVQATSRHYLWHTIQPRHWAEMARRCGIAVRWPALRDELVQRTPPAIDAVGKQLPRGFPSALAEAIFEGLRKSAAVLAAATA